MDELMKDLSALEEKIKGLQPATAQRASALNGVAHVRDNLKGHFERAANEAKAAAAGQAKATSSAA